jgi:hypothetical protein
MFKPEIKKDYFLYRYPQVLVRIDSEGKIAFEIIKTNYSKQSRALPPGLISGFHFFLLSPGLPGKRTL